MECQFSGNVINNPAVLQPSSTCQWFRLLTVCCQRFTHQPIVFLRCEANAYFIGSGCAASLFFLLASRGFAARRSLTRVANWRKEKRLLAVYFKLYLNSLVCHRNIFGSSSEVFGNLQTSSEIFENFRKMFGNVCLVFGTILENLRKSSEDGRKSLENHQKRPHQHVYIIKRTLHGGLRIWILFSCGKNNI